MKFFGIIFATSLALGGQAYAQLLPGSGTVPSWVPSSLPGNTGGLLYNSAGSLAAINSVASGAVLASGGVGSAPAFTTTPSLTSLLLSPVANSTPLTISGGSITGSSTVTPGISITGTLNTTGVVDGAALFANITNTASGAGTLLADLQVGSSSQFKVSMSGAIISGASSGNLALGFNGSSSNGFYAQGAGALFMVNGTKTFDIQSNAISLSNLGINGWSSSSDPNGTIDVSLSRSSAGVVAVGTGAQGSTAGSMSMTGITLASVGATINGSSSGSFSLTANSTGAPLLSGVTSSTAALNYMCYNSSTGAMTYDSSGTCLVSSLRFKRDVKPLVGSLAFVEAVDPISFIYKDQSVISGIQEGVAAESMAAADPLSVEYDDEGRPLKPKIMSLIAHLYGAVQAQQREIAALRRH